VSDDALHATRAAVEEGILPGGAWRCCAAVKALDGLKSANSDQKAGIEIVRGGAIQIPARQIAQNAGEDAGVVAGKLLEADRLQLGLQRLRRASIRIWSPMA